MDLKALLTLCTIDATLLRAQGKNGAFIRLLIHLFIEITVTSNVVIYPVFTREIMFQLLSCPPWTSHYW